jgi:C-terminal processing protease CtpA/Prc
VPLRLFLVLFLSATAARSVAQFKTELVNPQGATAPCVGIGPIGGPLAKKCADLFEQSGFLRTGDAGYSGLTIGTKGKDDGVILTIAPQSPAAQASLAVGDVITAVAGKPVQPTPGSIAAKAVFGQRGDTLKLTVKRAAAQVDISLVRALQNAPPGPKASGFMVVVKPMFNWQNQVVPCMGAGPAAMAAIEYCYGHFKPFGFIRAGDLGTAGFAIDTSNPAKAAVTTVDPDGPAAKAGLLPGDEIVAVNSQPLIASKGEAASELLFGKVGDKFKLTVQRAQDDPTVDLVLAAKPNK